MLMPVTNTAIHYETDLRQDLAAAIDVRTVAQARVDATSATLARARDHLALLMHKVDEARAIEAEAEQAEVERMHAAASACESLAEVHAIPFLVARAEATARPARALVDRLERELAQHEAAVMEATHAVNRIVGTIMQAEAEQVASDLWEARQRVQLLEARLGAFTRQTPPDRTAPKPGSAARGRRVDLGGGNFLVEANPLDYRPDRFDLTPTIARALNGKPGRDDAGFTARPGLDFVRDDDAWMTWAAALRTNSNAEPLPIPSSYEVLK